MRHVRATRRRSRVSEGREPILARAQLVLAREHGYASWPALVAAVEANAESFVLAATNRQRTRAESLLAARPELGDDPWAKLVLGRGWQGDPNEPGGPRGWAPLLYVCHSCFPSATLARELLSRGADPNVTFDNEYGAMSALYGAAGRRARPGADARAARGGREPRRRRVALPLDRVPSTDCLRLLLEHGAQTKDTNALAHALDEERLEHVRLLLEAGADPTTGAASSPTPCAAGSGPEFVRLLAAHGADLDRPGGETWRGNVPLRTPYQHAVLRGRDDTAAVLAELGASTELDPADAVVASPWRAASDRRRSSPTTLDPDPQEVSCSRRCAGTWTSSSTRSGPTSVVSWAARPWARCSTTRPGSGSAEVVTRLLERGANPDGGATSASGRRPSAGRRTARSTTHPGPRLRRGRRAARRRGEHVEPELPRPRRTGRSSRGSRSGCERYRRRSSRRARSRGARAGRRRAARVGDRRRPRSPPPAPRGPASRGGSRESDRSRGDGRSRARRTR